MTPEAQARKAVDPTLDPGGRGGAGRGHRERRVQAPVRSPRCAERAFLALARQARTRDRPRADLGRGKLIPLEVTDRARHAGAREPDGRIEPCQAKRIAHGIVITKSLDDFGTMQGLPVSPTDTAPGAPTVGTPVMRIPAPLLRYGMGATELPGDAE